jgi:hypothetical protein
MHTLSFTLFNLEWKYVNVPVYIVKFYSNSNTTIYTLNIQASDPGCYRDLHKAYKSSPTLHEYPRSTAHDKKTLC